MVVAVWATARASQMARTLWPGARRTIERFQGALCLDHDIEGDGGVVHVGQPPTQSTITLTPEGLVLRRGPAWSAPLYYRTRPFCAAASNIAALLREGDAIDVARLASLVGDVMHRGETRTVYRDIRMVAPLETVTLSRAGCSTVQRRAPTLTPIRRIAPVELAAELRARLFAAVARAAGNRTVGLMIGGVDSSSLLAALLAVRGARAEEIRQVTFDFDAPGSDRPHVRALESYFGLSVSRLPPERLSADDALVVGAVPSRHTGDVGMMECARHLHAAGAEVLMTGTGGDEFFGGDFATATVSGLADRDVAGAWDSARARFPYRAFIRYRARAVAVAALRPFIPQATRRRRGDGHIHRIPRWVGPVLRDEMERAIRARATRPLRHDLQARYEDTLTHPLNSELVAEIRAQFDAATPIPRTDPIYDEDVIGFLAAVPPQALFVGGEWRGLLREAMRGFLPESVRLRRDKSRFEPMLATAIPLERFASLLRFEALGRAGIVHADRYHAFFQPLLQAPADLDNGERWSMVWPALTAEAFLRSR